MTRRLSSLLLAVGLAAFMLVQGTPSVLAEELVEACDEKSPESEVADFDPTSDHARSCMVQVLGTATRSAWLTHDVAPAQEHVAEVPVPPPEAIG